MQIKEIKMEHRIKLIEINELKLKLLDREASDIDLINELIAIHFENHKDCDYHLKEKSVEIHDYMPIEPRETITIRSYFPPSISVTKTINVKD